ncbi:MAG: dUTP diphosphatase [Pseudoalteromonas sp.]|uniref:dUTP diphosphatase n=1 Tax=Pseudoalteromonas sp. TaxID=53249 RepID=UPI001E0006F7|nr:dUTP diphosphatase [Pseudoalteromonas sp.]NRA77163.1 dUTP diphosphatase [Pseudoalteromonas sp.]
MKIKLLTDTAQIPKQGKDGDAGYDLFADEAVVIPPGSSALVKIGISVEPPIGYHGFIWPRSKLSSRKRIAKLAGCVDGNYRGEIHACLINHGSDDMDIRVGDAIAQLIFQKTLTDFKWEVVDTLSETDRGNAGVTSSEMRLRHE